MTYALEEVAHVLKTARRAKGLSQRALSAKAGVTQAQISKIENAAVDLQLSNLIALARALDLELTLVPRRAVPAVQSIVRDANAAPALTAEAYTVLRMLQDATRQFSIRLPDTEAVPQLQSAIRALQSVPLTQMQIAALRKMAREAQRIAESLLSGVSYGGLAELGRLSQIAQEIHALRNNIAHAIPSAASAQPRPAYRLDDADDEDKSNG
ncbi:MAG: XRE family transcriptional regulator [Alphaproteobacteria bacterium]|nr:XRE family transcriptional regulator [Alphaproteobacteria bacterium]